MPDEATVEWCVMSPEGVLHRGPWDEHRSRAWVAETDTLYGKPSGFYVARRTCSPWTKVES